MKVPQLLSSVKLPGNKHALKLLSIALPAMLLPLVVLILLVANSTEFDGHLWIIGLPTTLATVGLMVMAYRKYIKLSQPISLVRKAVNDYAASKVLPALPAGGNDEAWMLMQDIQAVLEQVNEQLTEKSDMIDLLSHDLRSPVTRIMGLSNVIKLNDDPESVELADMISNECRNLLSLMENILLMFKGDVLAFAPQNVNLLRLANETVQFFSLLAGQKNLEFKVDIDEKLFINVQHGLFTQALRNILGNAIKFSRENKAIFISAGQVGHEVNITIRDEGLGLGQKELLQIFERFTKAGKKGTHGETSIGLGLYLCKKIIEKQGGKISARSEGADKGAVFTITLYQLITKKRSNENALQVHSANGKKMPPVK